jgi:hypothetical protein
MRPWKKPNSKKKEEAMNFNDWDDDGEPPDEMNAAEVYCRNDAEELLAINWRLILQTERQYQESRAAGTGAGI